MALLVLLLEKLDVCWQRVLRCQFFIITYFTEIVIDQHLRRRRGREEKSFQLFRIPRGGETLIWLVRGIFV